MPGRKKAIRTGKELEERVKHLAEKLNLICKTQVKAGRRIYGKKRSIDIVVQHPESDKTLGIECKYQGTPGTAEEKILATIRDIEFWPIAGIVVIAGEGFSPEILGYLYSTGKVVHFDDLED